MFWVCVQSESSQLETKLSGVQVTPGVKRDSLLARAGEMDRNYKTSKPVSVRTNFIYFSILRTHQSHLLKPFINGQLSQCQSEPDNLDSFHIQRAPKVLGY